MIRVPVSNYRCTSYFEVLFYLLPYTMLDDTYLPADYFFGGPHYCCDTTSIQNVPSLPTKQHDYMYVITAMYCCMCVCVAHTQNTSMTTQNTNAHTISSQLHDDDDGRELRRWYHIFLAVEFVIIYLSMLFVCKIKHPHTNYNNNSNSLSVLQMDNHGECLDVLSSHDTICARR